MDINRIYEIKLILEPIKVKEYLIPDTNDLNEYNIKINEYIKKDIINEIQESKIISIPGNKIRIEFNDNHVRENIIDSIKYKDIDEIEVIKTSKGDKIYIIPEINSMKEVYCIKELKELRVVIIEELGSIELNIMNKKQVKELIENYKDWKVIKDKIENNTQRITFYKDYQLIRITIIRGD